MTTKTLDELRVLSAKEPTEQEQALLTDLTKAANEKAALQGGYPNGVGVILWRSDDQPDNREDEIKLNTPGSYDSYYAYAVYCKMTKEVQNHFFAHVGKT